jgi:hypothetical protein
MDKITKEEKNMEKIKMEHNPNEISDNNVLPEEKNHKQLLWAIIIMVLVIVIILAVPFIIKNYFNSFEYSGIDFSKTKLGNIDLFSATIPIFSTDASGTVTGKDVTSEFTLNLRNDPRKLEDINVLLDKENITLTRDRTVYVSYNSSDPPCQHNVLSAANLARFFLDFENVNIEGAVINKDYANQNNIPYITCDNHPHGTVFLMLNGNENLITKIKDNCYLLQYKYCDMLPVTEKFMLTDVEGYMNKIYSKKDS